MFPPDQYRVISTLNDTPRRSPRGGLMIFGGLVALASLWIPGLYFVDYVPPEKGGYPRSTARIDDLVGWHSAASGPYDFRPVIVATLFLIALGIFTSILGFIAGRRALGLLSLALDLGKGMSAIAAGAVVVVAFYRQFWMYGTPQSFRNDVSRRFGGGIPGQEAANYVHGSIGLTSFLFFASFSLALIGAAPRVVGLIIAGVLALLLISFAAAVAHLNIPIITLDRTPLTPFTSSTKCGFVPGVLDQCESTQPRVSVDLNRQPTGSASCAFSVLIDWGDGKRQKVALKGTSALTQFVASHDYTTKGRFTLTSTTTVTKGQCEVPVSTFNFRFQPWPQGRYVPSALGKQPEETREKSQSGAEAFTRWYFRTLDHAALTGDAREAEVHGTPDCAFCKQQTALIRQWWPKGYPGIQAEGPTVVASVSAGSVKGDTATVRAITGSHTSRLVRPDGKVAETFPAGPAGQSKLTLRWVKDHWLVDSIGPG